MEKIITLEEWFEDFFRRAYKDVPDLDKHHLKNTYFAGAHAFYCCLASSDEKEPIVHILKQIDQHFLDEIKRVRDKNVEQEK